MWLQRKQVRFREITWQMTVIFWTDLSAKWWKRNHNLLPRQNVDLSFFFLCRFCCNREVAKQKKLSFSKKNFKLFYLNTVKVRQIRDSVSIFNGNFKIFYITHRMYTRQLPISVQIICWATVILYFSASIVNSRVRRPKANDVHCGFVF